MASCLIDGNHSRGDVFEDRFHQRAPAFQFLHRLLQVLREHVDLPAVVAELPGHSIERADQGLQFILRLDVHARLEIPSNDFLCRLRQRLNRHRNLLGQEKCKPCG